MKILFMDIESKPHTAYVWGLFDQNISTNQIIDTGGVMCFSYMWGGEEDVHFCSEWEDGHKQMIEKMHFLLDEADAVVTYNGDKFDLPMVKKEFVTYNILPPSPCKSIDLYKIVRKSFKFASNKLDHVCDMLDLGRKVQHGGMQLWIDCMAGVKEAQEIMKEYNLQDVAIMYKLYKRILPYITNHPNTAMFATRDGERCPNCNSPHLVKRGYYKSNIATYQRYRCNDCGTWSRSRFNVLDKSEREFLLVQAR